MTQPSVIDSVFRALADPTRRRVLEHLSRGPTSVSELAEAFSMELQSFVEQFAVLERGGLVKSKKKGRVRVYRINHQRFKVAENWLAEQRRLWETRLNQLDDYLYDLKHEGENL